MDCITYSSGYKYQLKQSYRLTIGLIPDQTITTDFITLTREGLLTLAKGYAWDGPSGPTLDTLNFMRGSLVHDALYQLMRENHLNHRQHRATADRLLQQLCKEDGMGSIRAWWVYWGVRLFANPAADPALNRPLIRAPKACQG